MKLLVRHTFPCTVDEFWELFWDPAYDARLQQGTAVRRELISDDDGADLRLQKFRFIPEKTLPAPIAKMAGTDKITYDQENRFDKRNRVLAWKVRPVIVPDKVTAEGTFTVKPAAGGCERVVEGTIEVRVPFIGGKIEQQIVSDVEAGYETAANVTREFIAARKSR